MAVTDFIFKLIGRDNSTQASVTTKGAKGALAVELLDSTGIQMDDLATETKQDTQITNQGTIISQLQALNSLIPAKYNEGVLAYDTNGNLTSAKFYLSGSLISTLSLVYDGSGNLINFNQS